MAVMETEFDVSSSVKVNGETLKADRKQAGHTQQSLMAECESVSLATLRRAEQGHRIRIVFLRRIAEVLGHDVQRYIRTDFLNQKTEFAISIDGKWVGLYIEADRGVPPYIVMDETTFHQTGDSVTGGSVNIDPTDEHGQFCDKGSQYRSEIFYHDEQQRQLAETSRQALTELKPFAGDVVTGISRATRFYPAEEYHQDYYLKNPVRYKFYRYGCGRDKRLEELWGTPDE